MEPDGAEEKRLPFEINPAERLFARTWMDAQGMVEAAVEGGVVVLMLAQKSHIVSATRAPGGFARFLRKCRSVP